MKFYETYGDRIFLTKDELKEYIKSQEKDGSRDGRAEVKKRKSYG